MRRSPIDRAMNLRDRVGAFATSQRDRFGGRNASVQAASLPVTVIPAPKVNERTWSPGDGPDANTAPEPEGQVDGERTVLPVAGDDQDDSSTDSSAANNVVFIPAPTEGRTWSPPDQRDPNQSNSQSNSANSRRSKDNDTPPSQRGISTSTPPARTSTSSLRNPALARTPRGTLTFSEEASRPQLSPPPPAATGPPSRRSTHSRPISITPISERLGVDPSTAIPNAAASRESSGEPIISSSARNDLAPSAPPQSDFEISSQSQAAQFTAEPTSIDRSVEVPETRATDPETTRGAGGVQNPGNSSKLDSDGAT